MYVSTNMIILIPQVKGLTGIQLIGIICGSTAIFFIILFIIITIYRKVKHINFNMNDESDIEFSTSSDFYAAPAEKQEDQFSQQNEKQNEQNSSIEDDRDLDFWL